MPEREEDLEKEDEGEAKEGEGLLEEDEEDEEEEEVDDIDTILSITSNFTEEGYKELLEDLADQMEEPYEEQPSLELCTLKEWARKIRGMF